jgi:hypothetical protein
MDDERSVFESALWRIAELGARCGQQSAGVDRQPMWEELERLITDLGAGLAASLHGDDAAVSRKVVRRLEQQLKYTARERDAALARADQHEAATACAREERDRYREQLAGQTQSARDARRVWQSQLQQSEALRAEIAAELERRADRITSLETALAAALAERDAVVAARDASLAASEDVTKQLASLAQGRCTESPLRAVQ